MGKTAQKSLNFGLNLCSLLHVLFPGASLCFHLWCIFRFQWVTNSFSHVSHWNRTCKPWLRRHYAGLDWCFRLHSWFFIRNQDQHTTYQFSELLLTTWFKLAKQVQMFLKYHLLHIFPPMTLKAFLNVARNMANITLQISIQFSQELFHKNHTAQASRTYRYQFSFQIRIKSVGRVNSFNLLKVKCILTLLR